MKKIIAKIIISIAVGIILGVYFGNKNEVVKYYTPYRPASYDGIPGAMKAEVSSNEYFQYDKEFQDQCLRETLFNYRSFLTYSIATTSVLLIVFFIGYLRNTDDR